MFFVLQFLFFDELGFDFVSCSDEGLVSSCSNWGMVVSGVCLVAAIMLILLPSLYWAPKRLMDCDRSAFWAFVWFVPVLGTLGLVLYCCMAESVAVDNKYLKKSKEK